MGDQNSYDSVHSSSPDDPVFNQQLMYRQWPRSGRTPMDVSDRTGWSSKPRPAYEQDEGKQLARAGGMRGMDRRRGGWLEQRGSGGLRGRMSSYLGPQHVVRQAQVGDSGQSRSQWERKWKPLEERGKFEEGGRREPPGLHSPDSRQFDTPQQRARMPGGWQPRENSPRDFDRERNTRGVIRRDWRPGVQNTKERGTGAVPEGGRHFDAPRRFRRGYGRRETEEDSSEGRGSQHGWKRQKASESNEWSSAPVTTSVPSSINLPQHGWKRQKTSESNEWSSAPVTTSVPSSVQQTDDAVKPPTTTDDGSATPAQRVKPDLWIKCSYPGCCLKKINLALLNDLDGLHTKLRELFNIQDETYRMYYKDGENDIIELSGETWEEFESTVRSIEVRPMYHPDDDD